MDNVIKLLFTLILIIPHIFYETLLAQWHQWRIQLGGSRSNCHTQNVVNVEIEYKYLDHELRRGRGNQTEEIQGRVKLAWVQII